MWRKTASDALKRNQEYSTAIRFHALKIRRYLVPWGFDSPSRHHDSKHLVCIRVFWVEDLKTVGVHEVCMNYFVRLCEVVVGAHCGVLRTF
jgi:hypothetical protein